MAASIPAPRPAAASALLLAAFLAVLPFSSSVALRNALLAGGALALALAARRGSLPRPWLPPARVLAPFAAYAAWCVASVAWSVDRPYSLAELRPDLLYPAVAFLVFFAATDGVHALDRWAWGLSAGLAGLAASAAAQKLALGEWDPQRWHGDVGSYATYVVLAAPALGWSFARTASRRLRAALAAVAVLTLVVTSWNDNRIAWVALAGMTVVAAALRPRSSGSPRPGAVLALAAAGLVVFAALFALAVHQRAEKLEHTPEAAEASLARDPRLAIWDYAAGRIAEAPWAGHGFGRGILRQQFRTGVVPGTDNPLYTHAHNTVLNVLLQGGAVGLALFAWLAGAVLREMAAGLAGGKERRLAAALGIVLLAGFAIRNLTDDFLVRHSAMLAWGLAGAVLGALRAPGATSARTPA